jgi:hypothetical protein
MVPAPRDAGARLGCARIGISEGEGVEATPPPENSRFSPSPHGGPIRATTTASAAKTHSTTPPRNNTCAVLASNQPDVETTRQARAMKSTTNTKDHRTPRPRYHAAAASANPTTHHTKRAAVT